MTALTPTHDRAALQLQLNERACLVACLCAAWCDTCTSYRLAFDQLALRHPDKCFAWVDIEDCAELVDALDIDNFPTILIQHGDEVAFLGTMLPDINQLHRLLSALSADAASSKASARNAQAPAGWSLRRLLQSDASSASVNLPAA
ncbi:MULTISPECIES: thioredoxin family protein [unclassified Undibacterium]|uniref:thioredoxin family protein n=1 Tax=unclassified Undibacterium TaxID=2630295 RepID=UPI002AC9E06A|nr:MULTISPECIES: thioredoxin family protein [unclassified Undibacterium]MEB0138063.1 thioredoxin family protein [Undibacterium sp. CCC2.1]MEB0171199.1 thioredoxin family protein [Undibacterium sp. CCC1.1]MEB0175244.1 thioredoxin family protein [Undibacterium sp. CCC3.4]MEB0214652.1 thioredoxin family protein [Undibacterium sp. 5I2]WPX42419.1 thioredoxin family protein [Undibacterium sp. CCC3.4]